MTVLRPPVVALVVLLAACVGTIGDPAGRGGEPGADGAEGSLAPAGLRLLTPVQYQNSLHDLLGADVPVDAVGQWRSSIAAAQGGVSLTAVEEYEASARAVAAAVFEDPTRRAALVGCDPALDGCSRAFLERFGRKAWRRPLTAVELDRFDGLVASIGESLGDPWSGLELTVAGLLQSPSFLYRVELGEPDPEDEARLRYSSHDMATRLSYLAWNTTPDDALLDAADEGALLDEAGVRAEMDRLLASERAREGVVHFFSDLLDLDALLTLEKDPTWMPAFTPTIGPAMREQLLRTIDGVVFGPGGGDYRDLFDTRETFLNPELAALYGMQDTTDEAFVPVTLPEDGPRAGILTLAGLLALHAGAADTSPTLRGKFVRNILLCQEIPPPPPGVVTVIPEPAPDELVTTRDLLSRHRDEPTCASCHGFMDPIGLALENFDAIGAYRPTQNGIRIDPSGDLDGVPFADAVELGRVLRDNPALGECLVRSLHRYATGHVEGGAELADIEARTAEVVSQGYRVQSAFEAVAVSEGFRFAAPSAAGDEGEEDDAP